jgi:hypothetical protein
MRRSCLILAAIGLASSAGVAMAQPGDFPLSPLAHAIACAPPPSLDGAPAKALRIVGSQDTVARTLFGNRDLLVIGGGTAAGVQLGQQFFIRRTMTFGGNSISRGAKTLGWLRVVAVSESTAIARVDDVCGGILLDDYLVPFVPPDAGSSADGKGTLGQPDFTTPGRIVVGNEDRSTLGAGEFALIDWGKTQGVVPGARFAIYRSVGDGLPLVSVGDGVVISMGASLALTRVTEARDAVYAGDLVAFRR